VLRSCENVSRTRASICATRTALASALDRVLYRRGSDQRSSRRSPRPAREERARLATCGSRRGHGSAARTPAALTVNTPHGTTTFDRKPSREKEHQALACTRTARRRRDLSLSRSRLESGTSRSWRAQAALFRHMSFRHPRRTRKHDGLIRLATPILLPPALYVRPALAPLQQRTRGGITPFCRGRTRGRSEHRRRDHRSLSVGRNRETLHDRRDFSLHRPP
jgi:hypothetical protein